VLEDVESGMGEGRHGEGRQGEGRQSEALIFRFANSTFFNTFKDY